jgi:extradiol dioxygenase family protein
MKPQPIIAVHQVQATAQWYCQLLDAQRGHGGDEYEQILRGQEMILQIHDLEGDENHGALGDASNRLGNGVILWFETDDFDALLERVKKYDLKPDREPSINVYAKQIELWLHDPDGYQVVIAGPSEYPRQPLSEENRS